MLQPPVEAHDEAAKSPLLLVSIIRRRKYSILLTAIAFSSLAAWAAMQLKPSFVATASVLMQQRNASITDISAIGGVIATDSLAVRTQSDILRSADLARGVVRQMRLTTMAEFAPNLTPGLAARLLKHLGVSTPQASPTPAEREELATQILLGMITVVNDGRSYVIDIKVKVTAGAAGAAQAAALSAELANAYAEFYVQFTGHMKSDSIRQANSFFDDRINALKEKMQAAEHAVQTYRAENDLVEDSVANANGPAVTIIGQQMAQLNADLTAAASDRAKKEASLEQINLARSSGADPQSGPEVIASPLIQRLREQQAELSAREAALAMTRGSANAELVAVRAAQRDAANQIATETAKVADSLRSSVATARIRETTLRANLAKLQTQVGAQGQTAVKLHELQNEAEIARLLYATYLKRFEETANQIDLQEPDATLVSHAGIPLGAMPPSRQQVVVAGAAVSVMLATLLAVVRERLRSGFRTAEQLEASVGAGTLGFLPKVRNMRDALRFNGRYPAFAEAIFSTRALLRLNVNQAAQVVMVTSALPQEGKTFFSASLARNAALAGERVLLVDCDLRRPAVAKTIITTGAHDPGHMSIRRDAFSSLDIITLPPDVLSPQDLFASPAMRNLMLNLRERYELIVLDTPPVLAVSDARVLAALADITVLVVRWQSTPRNLVNSAVNALRSSGAVVAGAVINQVKLNELDASDGATAGLYRNYARV